MLALNRHSHRTAGCKVAFHSGAFELQNVCRQLCLIADGLFTKRRPSRFREGVPVPFGKLGDLKELANNLEVGAYEK
jgi:hypothetical protein